MIKQRTWRSWVWLLATRGAVIYLAVILLAALLQRYLVYFPIKEREEDLLRQAEKEGLYPWRDRDNRLIGWRSSSPDAVSLLSKRLIVFHGNAGYALHRTYYVNGFHSLPKGKTEWELFLFEYPGYGSRPGSPTEGNIIDTAREAIKDFKEDPRPLYLLGRIAGKQLRFAPRFRKSTARFRSLPRHSIDLYGRCGCEALRFLRCGLYCASVTMCSRI